MIKHGTKWFVIGYLTATFLNFSAGWFEWQTVLDLLNAAVLGFQMTTGFKSEAMIIADADSNGDHSH